MVIMAKKEEKIYEDLLGVGEYIKTLRGRTTREQLAEELETSVSNVVRIESATQNPGILTLVRVLEKVGGRIEDVDQLIRTGGREAQGQILAYDRLAQRQRDVLSGVKATPSLTADEIARVAQKGKALNTTVQGGLHMTLQDFLEALRRDPNAHHELADEVKRRVLDATGQADSG